MGRELAEHRNLPEIMSKRKHLAAVLIEVFHERRRQDLRWGGPEHDDGHGPHDWIAYIMRHAGRAVMWPWDRSTFRRQMIRVAALAVAAVEWCDRGESTTREGEL